MTDRVPVCLLLDDPAPLIHVYRYHWEHVHHKPPVTEDGRPMPDTIPNDFLDRFCDVMDRRGIKGKFSIVPSPAGLGDVVQGIHGFDPTLTRAWLETANRRLGPICDFCPEGITHDFAVNLTEGGYFPESEHGWSQRQTRETLTPYLARSLKLLRDAGIECTGVTSPWEFGIQVEDEYVAAIVAAQKEVYGLDFSWYFLHMIWENPRRPWNAYRDGKTTLVSIPATVSDHFWATINCARSDPEYVSQIADRILTADGKGGQVADVLQSGNWPILCTHWQSLFSTGLETGLAALDEVGRRVEECLSDRVEWMTCSQIARLTAESPAR